jgi:membrane associated rhomboid family serine protease
LFYYSKDDKIHQKNDFMPEFSLTLMLVLLTGFASYRAFDNPILKSRLLFIPNLIERNGQWERFLTHGFIHADWLHLLLNMFVFYMFGQNVEAYFNVYFGETLGAVLYLVLYLGGIIVASVPSYFKQRNNPMYAALGASGAVAGVVFVNIFFDPWSMIYIYGIVPIPIVVGGVLYLWYSDYSGKRGNDNIGHDAHFFGAIWGFAFTFLVAAMLDFELVRRFFQLLLRF